MIISKTESEENTPAWRKLGRRFFPFSLAMRQEFGMPVRKIGLDAGFSCPNTPSGGCIFCNVKSFAPMRRAKVGTITEQIDAALSTKKTKSGSHGQQNQSYLAYFQPSTNTFAPLPRLREVFDEAIRHDRIVGLLIGTRPDCLEEPVLELLEEISHKIWLQLEIGLQSTHDQTLEWLGRGHDYACFLDTVARAAARHLRLGVHLILGLPTESLEDQRVTADRMASLPITGVKLHHLHVVRDTRLAALWQAGCVKLPSMREYVTMAADFLERLPASTVIDRLAGSTSAEYLLAPDWPQSMPELRLALEKELEARDSWQGKHCLNISTGHR